MKSMRTIIVAALLIVKLAVQPAVAGWFGSDHKSKDDQFANDVARQAALQAGNYASRWARLATDRMIDDLVELSNKVASQATGTVVIENGIAVYRGLGLEAANGKIFEDLHAYTLDANHIRKGVLPNDKYAVTGSSKFKAPHAPDDLRLLREGQVVAGAQLKIHIGPNAKMEDYVSSFMGRVSKNGQLVDNFIKYKKLQLIVPFEHYGELQTHISEQISKAERSLASGNLTAEQALKVQERVLRLKDVQPRLGAQVIDPVTGIASDPITAEQMKALSEPVLDHDGKPFLKDGKPVLKPSLKKYAEFIERERRKWYLREIKSTSLHMAATEGIIRGAMSGVSNLWQYANGEKSLKDALADTGIETAKGVVHGGTTGALTGTFRVVGQMNGYEMLQNGSLMTVVAAGLVDCGVSVIDYARGAITPEQLQEQLIDTAGKSLVSVCITKGVALVFGSTAGFVPMAAYTLSSWLFTTTRDILRENELTIQEARRVAALYAAAEAQMEESNKQLKQLFASLKSERAEAMKSFLTSFDAGVDADDYEAIAASVALFAANMHLSLQHTDFQDFSRDMSDSNYTFKF